MAVCIFEQVTSFVPGSLRLRSSRAHASICGRRDGRQHHAVSMQFPRAHLFGVLDKIDISAEHGIEGTAFRGEFEGTRSREQRSGTYKFSRHETRELYRSGTRRCAGWSCS